jgi:hypothetical protein
MDLCILLLAAVTLAACLRVGMRISNPYADSSWGKENANLRLVAICPGFRRPIVLAFNASP